MGLHRVSNDAGRLSQLWIPTPPVIWCAVRAHVASVESSSDPRAALAAAVSAERAEAFGKRVFAPPVLITARGSTERVAGRDDKDRVDDVDVGAT